MASRTLRNNNNDRVRAPRVPVTPINEDDITETAGSNREKKHGVEEEKIVKWQLSGSYDSATAKKALINLLTTLILNHPQELIFIDKKQREWSFNETDNEEKFSKEINKASVQLHSIKNKQQKNSSLGCNHSNGVHHRHPGLEKQ